MFCILKYLIISSFITEYSFDSNIVSGDIISVSERQKEKSSKVFFKSFIVWKQYLSFSVSIIKTDILNNFFDDIKALIVAIFGEFKLLWLNVLTVFIKLL